MLKIKDSNRMLKKLKVMLIVAKRGTNKVLVIHFWSKQKKIFFGKMNSWIPSTFLIQSYNKTPKITSTNIYADYNQVL